jgi:hypothetical protein
MKRKSNITCLLSILALLFGCGGGGVRPSPPSSIPPAGPPSGPPAQNQNTSTNWQLSATSTNPTGPSPAKISGTIIQAGSAVTAALHVDGWTCFDQQTTMALTGTLTDGNVSMTSASVNGQVVTLAAAISKKSNFPDVFNGTYAVNGGCADGDQGNVSGISVYSTTGYWAGNLTTAGGGNIHWSAQLAQGNPSPEGSFGLTGAITFDGCFGSGTITSGTFPSGSFILGQSVTLEIKTGNGTMTFLGTADDDGLIRGSYTVSGGPCEAGTGYLSPWEY